MLKNEYLFAKIGFDTAETGPLKVRQNVRKNIGKCTFHKDLTLAAQDDAVSGPKKS